MHVPLHYRATADEWETKSAAPEMVPNDAGELVPSGVELFDVSDIPRRRQLFFDAAASQLAQSFPQSYGGLRVELADLSYEGGKDFTPTEQKRARLAGNSLAHRLRGTMRLIDETSGTPVEEKRLTLMNVPYLTDRGTFINNGSEYTTVTQSRLESGPYTRRRDSGDLETQFNVKPGTGRQFRVGLEPTTAQYRLRISTSNLHLYSLLHDLGIDDDHLSALWGPEILEANRAKYDKRVFGKAYEKFVPSWKRVADASIEEKRAQVKAALEEAQMNEAIAQRNLPVLWDRRKQAAYRKPDPATFFPDIRPDAVRESLRVTAPADYAVKFASIDIRELQALAVFVSRATGIPIPLQLAKPDLEDAIIQAVTSGPSGVNAAVLNAGIEGLAKTAAEREDFKPDYTPDQMIDIYNSIYGHVGPRLASMKEWPENWLHPDDPMGWLQWYEQYDAGRRHPDDERQIRRWHGMRSRHGAQLRKNPTPRRAWALRNWAIDPLRLIDDPAARKKLEADMEAYKARETSKQLARQ